jgi:MoaA/NifB/PqqE/SkfB family radical SAM enzyme
MCSVEKYKKYSVGDLSLSDYKKLSREARELGVIAFSILGGEPTMKGNLEEIIQALDPARFFITMVTNSISLTKERLASLQESGLNSICFSLDNLDKDKNNEIRGNKGHYDKVMQAIKWSNKLGLHITISPVAFHGELGGFREILEYAKKNGFAVGAGAVGYVGNAEGKDDILLTEAENKTLREWLKKYHFLRFDWSLSYKLKHQCPAGQEKIGITNIGDVVGCSLNPISFGNIRKEPLKVIWERMNRFSQFAKDFPGCLVAEDRHYIDNYIRPIIDKPANPVFYKDHPSIRNDIKD